MNSKALRRDICVKVCGREAMMQEKSKEQGNGQKRGYNLLDKEEQKSMLSCFVEQLCDPLIFILFAAAAISLLLREYGDMCIILAVVLLNAVVGVIQEGKAKRALEALEKMTSPHALIHDEDGIREIPAADLIPGDIVCLEAGRQVPADIRIISAVNLKIEESALTGESVPVSKNTTDQNEAYMTTNVTYGRGEGIVTAIGMDTKIGGIAKLLSGTKTELTPLQKRLADLGKILGTVSVFLCILLFVMAVLQRRNVAEMLITAISLAVAAVPEGLPAIVTMVLALSVSRMVKVNTIVKRLPSVETLGCVSVVCSDKTGTLTQNRMTVTKCYTDGKICEPKRLNRRKDRYFLEGYALCNDASIRGERIGDPTELALLDMAAGFEIQRERLEESFPRTQEIAFDSERKMMTTLHRGEKENVSYTKGSPDEILERSAFLLEGGGADSNDAGETQRDRSGDPCVYRGGTPGTGTWNEKSGLRFKGKRVNVYRVCRNGRSHTPGGRGCCAGILPCGCKDGHDHGGSDRHGVCDCERTAHCVGRKRMHFRGGINGNDG